LPLSTVESQLHCFVAGTEILTVDGVKNIEDIQVGDFVIADDQTGDIESLSLEAIAEAEQARIIENHIRFRDPNGTYIDRLSELLRKMTLDKMQDYLSKSDVNIYENVISFRRKLVDNCFAIHFVAVAQRNILVNLETTFARVTASIFVNFSDERPNLSLFKIQNNLLVTNAPNKKEINSLLKDIYWYVLDIEQPERVIDFLKRIQADFTLIPYISDEYDYFQDILLDLESRISSAIAQYQQISDNIDNIK